MPRLSSSADPTMPDAAWKREFRRRLLAWFERHQRDLPWRANRDPYRVWLSEIMLQQTQVVTVIPYFERFLAAFPTVQALADAEESAVLRLWEGLGYYRRARQLHKAAQVIVAEHGGEFPRNLETIGKLPGIGRYTAGAIASIAFDLPAPILEANTVRLYCRLLEYFGDPTTVAGQRLLWEFAEAILPTRQAGTLNQALMELGSLICTPREPKCDACPVSSLCPTFAAGLQEQIPIAKRKPKFEAVREAAVVIYHGKKVLIRQRAHGERWAGLWDFVRFPLDASEGAALSEEIEQKTYQQVGVKIAVENRIATIKHGVTRFRITLECYRAIRIFGRAKEDQTPSLRWVSPKELSDYPLSTTGRKLAQLLANLSKTRG